MSALKRLRLKHSVVFIAAVSAIILIFSAAFSSCNRKLEFRQSYFFVYYKIQQDANSASSISSTVQSYGGAGYIIKSGNNYYITIACYYSDPDAQIVCSNLQTKGLPCSVLKRSVESYALNSSNAEKNKEKYSGNLNTLNSLSRLCYETANAVDTGQCDQIKAKSVLADVKSTLSGLLRANSSNCFTAELSYLITECEDVSYGYVYSRDIRKLQIALIDCILNIKLY